MSRTPRGHPDLQGTCTSKTIAPLQRPAELASRELLTAEKVANLEQEVVDPPEDARLAARGTHGPADTWTEAADEPDLSVSRMNRPE